MGMLDSGFYYKIKDVKYRISTINGTEEIHVYGKLEHYNERNGKLLCETDLFFIDNEFDINGDLIAEMYKSAKRNHLKYFEDVIE